MLVTSTSSVVAPAARDRATTESRLGYTSRSMGGHAGEATLFGTAGPWLRQRAGCAATWLGKPIPIFIVIPFALFVDAGEHFGVAAVGPAPRARLAAATTISSAPGRHVSSDTVSATK